MYSISKSKLPNRRALKRDCHNERPQLILEPGQLLGLHVVRAKEGRKEGFQAARTAFVARLRNLPAVKVW